MDIQQAWKLLSESANHLLANLISAPLRLASQLEVPATGMIASTSTSTTPPRLAVGGLPAVAADWEDLGHMLSAAGSAAGLLLTVLQLVPDCQPSICQAELFGQLLACIALAAALGAALLPARAPPAAAVTQVRTWHTLAALANATAHLLPMGDTWQEHVLQGGPLGGPLPPAVAVALAMQLAGSSDVTGACTRLLQFLLSRKEWAAAFLQGQAGAPACVSSKSALSLHALHLPVRWQSHEQKQHFFLCMT